MAILIKSLHTGVIVDYSDTVAGVLVGYAGGHEIRLLGNAPKGHTLNQVLAMCLPHIVALTGAPAASISYARLSQAPRKKKVSPKQKGMFDD